MTARAYADYLKAVSMLSDQAAVLATTLDEAALLGQTALDAASARTRDAEVDFRATSERLRSANDLLARLSREVGFDLEPAAFKQPAPRSIAEADRLLADMQRELTAIERNCEWVRRNRSARIPSALSRPGSSQAGSATAAVPVPVVAVPPAKPVWQSPVVWIVAALAVLVVLVLVLILK